jgi:hypothetical protein
VASLVRAPSRDDQHLQRAFAHPLNVSVLVVLFVFALAYGLFPWLVLGVALELSVLWLLSRTRPFRRRAERQLRQAELSSLRLSLDGSQLRELQRLEELAAAVRGSPLVDSAALERLIEGWIRLAATQKAARDLLVASDRRLLEHEIGALTAGAAQAAPPLRRLQEQRLALARRRLERLDATAERLELVGHQLSAIAELLHYLHEEVRAPSSLSTFGRLGDFSVEEELERIFGDLGDHERALAELEAAPALGYDGGR